MYPQSFLCEDAEIQQHTSLQKKLCETGEEAVWESRFKSFFCFINSVVPKIVLSIVFFQAIILLFVNNVNKSNLCLYIKL